MTQVDFYIIPESTLDAKFRFACRVVEKAYQHQRKIYIHTDNAAIASQLNDLLWTFHDTSFIPHDLVGTHHEKQPTILIGFNHKPDDHNDILVNLSEVIPEFHQDFDRIIEVVIQEEHQQQLSREHFKFYKSHSYSMNNYDLRK